jgi:hypothetical protein
LKNVHPVYATKHTIRLQLKCRLYRQAILTLEDHDFCFLRTQTLGRDRAVFHHIKDCCRIQHSYVDAMLPRYNMDRAIHVMAEIAKDPTAYFLLGQFLSHQRHPLAVKMLLLTIDALEKDITSELHLLAASLERIAIIYMCYGQKDRYEEYRGISNSLFSKGDTLLYLFQAIQFHSSTEGLHTVTSQGFRHQLECVKNRLLSLRTKLLPILNDSYLLIGNLERASLIAQIIDSIKLKSCTQVQQRSWFVFPCFNFPR